MVYFPEITRIGLAWSSLLNLVGPKAWTSAQKSETNSLKNCCCYERSVVNPCNLVKPSFDLIKICSRTIAETHQCSGGFHECWCSSRNCWSWIWFALNRCNTLSIDIHLVSINCRHLVFIFKMRYFCLCKLGVVSSCFCNKLHKCTMQKLSCCRLNNQIQLMSTTPNTIYQMRCIVTKVGNKTLILTSHVRGSICWYTNELIFPSTAQCIQEFFYQVVHV